MAPRADNVDERLFDAQSQAVAVPTRAGKHHGQVISPGRFLLVKGQ